MSSDLIVITILLFVGFGFLAYFINKKLSERPTSDQALVEWLKSMQEAMRTSSVDITKTLQENTRQVSERLDQASSVIRSVSHEVGQMSEIGRGMRELQEFLKSPKLRGNIGEQVLNDLIAQMFPKSSFHLQYEFKSGDKVDAAIQTDAGILPIDSKFPMENFEKMIKGQTEGDRNSARKEFTRDVKRHIDAIAKKYILPEEGTMDFALMYLPSESVFYEIANSQEINDYARKNRVYPVSPSTLYAHLQMILLSFEGKKIESKSREVFRLLRAIQGDYLKIDQNMEVLGKHIGNAASQFNHVSTSFSQMGHKLDTSRSLSLDQKSRPEQTQKSP